MTHGQHFVDRNMSDLINRVTVVPAILDQLYQSGFMQHEMYMEICDEKTSFKQMRMLMQKVIMPGGNRAKDKLCRILERNEQFLMEELQRRCSGLLSNYTSQMEDTPLSALEYVRNGRKVLVEGLRFPISTAEELNERGILSEEELCAIRGLSGGADATSKLLDMIIAKGEQACYVLLQILKNIPEGKVKDLLPVQSLSAPQDSLEEDFYQLINRFTLKGKKGPRNTSLPRRIGNYLHFHVKEDEDEAAIEEAAAIMKQHPWKIQLYLTTSSYTDPLARGLKRQYYCVSDAEVSGAVGGQVNPGEVGEKGGASRYMINGKHFVDRNMTDLINRVTEVPPILDQLYQSGFMQHEMYMEICDERISCKQMRMLMQKVIIPGNNHAKDELCRILEKVQKYLMEDLKRK